MRTLSQAAKNAIFSSQSSSAWLLLLTLEHDDLDSPVRVTSDAVDTVSNGDTYVPFPFVITLPDETDDELPTVKLTIDAIDRSIITIIRTLTSAPTLTLNVVLSDDADTVEAGPFEFTLRNVQYTAQTVTGDLQFEDILNEPFPAGTYDPARYPGLF